MPSVVAPARRAGPDLAVAVLGDLEVHLQVDRAAGLEVEVEDERAAVEGARLRRRANACGATHAVAPDEREPLRAGVGRRPRSCLGTIPRSSSMGWKSAPRRSSSGSWIGSPVIAPHRDPLAQRAGGLEPFAPRAAAATRPGAPARR